MESLVLEILDALRCVDHLDASALDRIVRKHCQQVEGGRAVYSKRKLLPYYLSVKANEPARFESWGIDDSLEERFVNTVRVKPRRSASGVATITVITKPAPCSGTCIFCPSDVRMPKSYLHDEPACQRAERSWFDPYLQLSARLDTLEQMGHATDKIEVIILGGTFSDYSREYRTWFACELFRALNASDEERSETCSQIRSRYRRARIPSDPSEIETAVAPIQQAIVNGCITYNEAIAELHEREPWATSVRNENASFEELEAAQKDNETAARRCVGLVVETRPDSVSPALLRELRMLGCTKIQLGVQSVDAGILALNGRSVPVDAIARSLSLARLFGFKTHAHFMANLLGATPESDKADYLAFVSDKRFRPDEIKLYPCALVDGTPLAHLYRNGSWQPYTEEELLDILVADVLATPPYTRVSRMIRDISANDILAGNKKANLRQLVEKRLSNDEYATVKEMRFRELATSAVDFSTLRFEDVAYATSTTEEHFLQWVTPSYGLVGFLRLSLPSQSDIEALGIESPVGFSEAMIREVHIYGFATHLSREGSSAQHHGLGRALVEIACSTSQAAGFDRINVISAIGTRDYYRKLGFVDNGLYQTKDLASISHDNTCTCP